jgi:hypothetical protein
VGAKFVQRATQDADNGDMPPPVLFDDAVALDEGTVLTSPTSVQEELEAEVCLPLATPVLRGRPRLRRSRTPVSITSLWRSGRIAGKPRAANATRQAQLVLLKRLGI